MALGRGAAVVLALTLFVSVSTAARLAPEKFGEEKTYAPPYGTPSGGSPVTPDVPYSPTPTVPSNDSPVVPVPDVPYSPPYTPATPYTPDPSVPAVPTPTPASPGSCSWWSSNTSSFPDIISIFTTILDLFGSLSGSGSSPLSSITSIFGNSMTIQQGLTSTRNDGYGALLRQGSAAILNSYTRRDYAYSPFQVKLQFRNALSSQQQAFQMASLFENANLALGRRQ